MDRRRALRKFELGGFVRDVGKGVEEQARRREIEEGKRRMKELKEGSQVSDRRLEEARKRWAERQMVEWRRAEREERNKMWTTPGLRPLAEAPILDWEDFKRHWVPSDLRYKALFPNDPEIRCRAKDVRGEGAVLTEYTYHAKLMVDDPEAESTRQLFYENLYQDLYQECEVVGQEYWDIWAKASNLARFEFGKLDNDGRTTRLEEWIKKGAYILEGQDDEVRKRYGYLLPPDFVESRLATFEFVHKIAVGGVAILITQLENGEDVFSTWNDEEILKKYGHLQKYYRPRR